MRLIILPTSTAILTCTECDSTDGYAPLTSNAHEWTCTHCGHVINLMDVEPNLEPDERPVTAFVAPGQARLATSARPGHCATCGTANQHHFSVRLGDTMPATFTPCPDQD